MASNYNTKSIVFEKLALCLDAANEASYNTVSFGEEVNAQTSYTSEGSYTFTVPVGITSISAVAIGGGGAGGSQSSSEGAGGGGGGAMAWGTIPVTPLEDLTIVVGEGGECPSTSSDGQDGGDSKIQRGVLTLLQGGGGEGGEYAGTGAGGEGGTSSGTYRTGGGEGGNGGNGGSDNGGGGGGAAGYEGNGGNGSGTGAGSDGAGGGGGGGGANTSGATREGGGVGFFGEGSNGEGGESAEDGQPGSGGLGVVFGAGGGGAKRISGLAGSDGAVGGVRIVYKQPIIGDRQYPTLANIANTSYTTMSPNWNDVANKKKGDLYGPIYNSDDGGSLVFNGTSDYALLKPGSETLFGTGAFAVELWVRFSGAGSWYFLDTRIDGLDLSSWAIYMEVNERILWYQGDGTSCFNTSDMPNWSTGDNGWNHIVFSREGTGSNEFKAYVNGEHKASDTDDINYDGMPFYTQLHIGRRYSNEGFMNGRLSTLRIYKGRALSAAEVLQNYNATKRRFGL